MPSAGKKKNKPTQKKYNLEHKIGPNTGPRRVKGRWVGKRGLKD